MHLCKATIAAGSRTAHGRFPVENEQPLQPTALAALRPLWMCVPQYCSENQGIEARSVTETNGQFLGIERY